MSGALLRTKRARQVIVGVGDIRAVLLVKGYLKKVRKTPAVVARATRSIRADRSRVNKMVARDVLRKGGQRVVAIYAFRGIDVPLRPAICGSIRARRLHCRGVIRISRDARPQPCDHDVAIRVGGHPRKHVRLSNGPAAIHPHRRPPRRS